jgi:hypothetical protein
MLLLKLLKRLVDKNSKRKFVVIVAACFNRLCEQVICQDNSIENKAMVLSLFLSVYTMAKILLRWGVLKIKSIIFLFFETHYLSVVFAIV